MQEVPVEVPVVSVAGDQSEPMPEQNTSHHSPTTPTTSLVNDYESPWRMHQVNVMRVLSSVVSQIVTSSLREITHITFPAEVCYPYSLLELYAYRLLPLFTLSYNINKHKDDPFERFLWFLRLVIFQCLPVVIGMESKKPFSPVICEHFVAWMKHSPENYTEFFAEQVSHNPDITGLFMRNTTENITLEGTVEVSTYLPLIPNYIIIQNLGEMTFKTAYGTIKMSKLLPNMKIQNLMDPRGKYFVWEDTIVIEDEVNGFKAELEFKEGSKKETIIKGEIKNTKTNEKMFNIKGIAGKDAKMFKNKEDEKQILYQFPDTDIKGLVKILEQEYPISHLTKECQLAMNSCRIWSEVISDIYNIEMDAAETAKINVGNAKRAREPHLKDENKNYKYIFFKKNNQEEVKEDKKVKPTFSFGQEYTINDKFFVDMAEKVKLEEEKVAALEAEKKPEQPTLDGAKGEQGCIIS